MRKKVEALQDEIKDLALKWFQAVYEMDGLLWSANKILSQFEKPDWEELQVILPTWNNSQLQILASALSSGNENGVLVDDKFFYGYIFTLVNDSTALFMLDEMDYFLENNIESTDLLYLMDEKVEKLKSNGILSDDNTYEYWKKTFGDSIKKASR